MSLKYKKNTENKSSNEKKRWDADVEKHETDLLEAVVALFGD